MRATMSDGRQLVGQMLAFDKHMNLVLADCEEFRRVKRKGGKVSGAPGAAATTGAVVETEEKRMLGLAIIRGATVVSCALEGPPPSDPAARLGNSASGGGPAPSAVQSGPGISRPAGRGTGIGLQGPAAGVGGPGFPGAGFGVPPGFPGRGGPPGFGPPGGFPPGAAPGGFAPPQGFAPPGGRGFPPGPGGFPGR
nr:small nuclear ribonucleoprotein-associated protein b [Quercus suber]